MGTVLAMARPSSNPDWLSSLSRAWRAGDIAGFELELRGLPNCPEFRDLDGDREDAFAGIMEQLRILPHAQRRDGEATERLDVCLSLLSHIAGSEAERG